MSSLKIDLRRLLRIWGIFLIFFIRPCVWEGVYILDGTSVFWECYFRLILVALDTTCILCEPRLSPPPRPIVFFLPSRSPTSPFSPSESDCLFPYFASPLQLFGRFVYESQLLFWQRGPKATQDSFFPPCRGQHSRVTVTQRSVFSLFPTLSSDIAFAARWPKLTHTVVQRGFPYSNLFKLANCARLPVPYSNPHASLHVPFRIHKPRTGARCSCFFIAPINWSFLRLISTINCWSWYAHESEQTFDLFTFYFP